MQRSKKHETVIGMVLEDIYTDFSKELIQSVLNAIPQNKNIRLVVLAGKYDHGDSEYTDHAYKTVYNTIFKLSEMCDLDGLIIHLGSIGSHRGERKVERQLERYKSIPKIFIACNAPDLTTVNYDNETGIREAVDALVNVNGLTKLCMLGGRDDNTDAQLRKEIFTRCLRENGIEFTDRNYVSSSMSVESEANAAELLDKNPGTQAIFCVNDAVAKGLYNVMEQRGLVPGRDILVFGFDNTRMAGEMIPSLSSVGLERLLSFCLRRSRARMLNLHLCRQGCTGASRSRTKCMTTQSLICSKAILPLFTECLMTAFTDTKAKRAAESLSTSSGCSLR